MSICVSSATLGSTIKGVVMADPDEKTGVARILRTTTWCLVAAGTGHLLIWAGWLVYRGGHGIWVPWQPVVGISIAAIACLAFGGFYAASRRARVAIAATFLLTFFTLLSYQLHLRQLSEVTGTDIPGGAPELIKDMRTSVATIIGFYFGSEAAISAAKALGVAFGKTENIAAVMTSDRDVAKTDPDVDKDISIAQLK